MVSEGTYTYNRTLPPHVERAQEAAFQRVAAKMQAARAEEEALNEKVKGHWREQNARYVEQQRAARARQDALNRHLATQVAEAEDRRRREEREFKFVGYANADDLKVYPVGKKYNPEQIQREKIAWKKEIDDTVAVGDAIKRAAAAEKQRYEAGLAEAYRRAIAAQREEAFARKAADQAAVEKAWARAADMASTFEVTVTHGKAVKREKAMLTKVV